VRGGQPLDVMGPHFPGQELGGLVLDPSDQEDDLVLFHGPMIVLHQTIVKIYFGDQNTFHYKKPAPKGNGLNFHDAGYRLQKLGRSD